MKHTSTHATPASRREGIAMIASHTTQRLLVAAIAIAGLTGGVMVARAETFSQRVTSPDAQDLSVTAAPEWPAVEMTPCAGDPCEVSLEAGTSSVSVTDVANGTFDVPILGFGVNGGALALAGAPTSTIKVPVGTTLEITLTQPTIPDTIDLSFPSLGVGKVSHSGNVYTVHADTVGTSVFQPGANNQAPVQIAMGLVGVLIVTPTDGGGANCAACAYDAATSYADEAVVATTDLDWEFATAYPNDFDMAYFGTPKHADDTPRRVYHVINGKSFPNTDVIDVRASDHVLLRYVNAGVTDKSMGLLGLRQTLLARNASQYAEQQTVIAPLVGPGETADVEIVIPDDAIAGQKYSLMDQGRQMNHGTDAGFGGALTFLNVWVGSVPPTITGLAYDIDTDLATATGTPSNETATLTGFQTLVTDTATPPVATDWVGPVELFAGLNPGDPASISTSLPALPAGKYLWMRVQEGTSFSQPAMVLVASIAPTVSGVGVTGSDLTAAGQSDPTLTITRYQTFVNDGTAVTATDWVGSPLVPIPLPAASVAISGTVSAAPGDTVWVRVEDSLGAWSAPASAIAVAAPLPSIADPTASAVGYDGVAITATGAADPTLTITGYEVAVTDLDTDTPVWSVLVAVGSPAVSVSISEPASPTLGQWVWVRVQDSNGTWSAPAKAEVK